MSSTTLPHISDPQYKVLSFDLYGTLIDWSTGIYPFLLPLLDSPILPQDHPYRQPYPPQPSTSSSQLPLEHPLIAAFSAEEARTQDNNPTMAFEDVLRAAYVTIALETGAKVHVDDVDAMVQSSTSWPAFPDTVAAMQRLRDSGRYNFIALSNNSRAGLKAVLAGPLKDVHFDKAFSAEEIGSYKGSKRNFEYLLDGVKELGEVAGEQWTKENLLHVAHGVGTDQVPCDEMMIRHVWIERGVDNWRGKDQGAMKGLVEVKDMQTLAEILLQD